MRARDYLLALTQSEILGPSRLQRLRGVFTTWQKIWEANTHNLQKAGLKNSQIEKLIYHRHNFKFEKTHLELKEKNIHYITIDELEYPPLLKMISLPPPLLYYQGNLNLFTDQSLAIVGARKATSYGELVLKKFVPELAQASFLIISGLALGIDGLAHTLTLEHHGRTAAVLGSGLDHIYPRQHRSLNQSIKQTGCLISQFKPGTPPCKQNFPQRNHLIAGLAYATLVVEAGEKSGALRTAESAKTIGRLVLTVPGNIFSPQNVGTHNLFKKGARIITSIDDIYELYNKQNSLKTVKKIQPQLSDEEALILEYLDYEPQHINELQKQTKLDMKAINSRLTIMELNGVVQHVGNMNYLRLR